MGKTFFALALIAIATSNSHFGIGVNWNGLWKGRGSCRSLMSANRLASFFAR